MRAMGFDPSRKHKTTNFDYFFVVAAFVVSLGLILWVLFA
jgi:hypothetical protein